MYKLPKKGSFNHFKVTFIKNTPMNGNPEPITMLVITNYKEKTVCSVVALNGFIQLNTFMIKSLSPYLRH